MFEELKPHLVELRKRLAISIFAVIVCFGLCFLFWNPLLAWMTAPLKQALPADTSFARDILAVLALCRAGTLRK